MCSILHSADTSVGQRKYADNVRDRVNEKLVTILATDSSVATPVSAAEQIATIQAEQNAYAGR